MSRHRALFAVAIVALLIATDTSAADAPSFAKDIAPMLTAKCAKCHGATRQKNDLRLDSAEAVQKGGKNGPVVVAGKPDQSPIFVRTTKPPGDADRMPAEGQLLTRKQTDLIKAWIAAGAKFD
jgi:mono/diheme cytochrome c family protein